MATEKIQKMAMRTATLNKEIDVENRKVNLCFMTEKACDNWFVPEVCLCNRENADLTRFENGIAPVLFNHDRDRIIGRIEEITFENQRANATIVFDSDEESDAIFQKVQSGSLRGVSVGYIRSKCTRVNASEDLPIEFMGRTYKERTDVTSLWELLEISIVSVPADNDTGVGRELGDVEIDVLSLNKEEEKELPKMAEEIKETVNLEEERALAIKNERARAQEIMTLCRTFNIDKADTYIADGKTVDQVRACILDELKTQSKPAHVVSGESDDEKYRRAVVGGLCLRYGVTQDKVVDGAEQFRGMSLRSLAEDILERSGVSGVRYMKADELCERAMGSETFQGVIDNFANKVMLKAYNERPFVWKQFVSIGSNPDFKPTHKYEMGLDGLPVLMPQESGEFKYQEMGDAKISTAIQTYGKAIRFTREIFINDDMGQVQKAISLQAGGFARLKEIMFFETLKNVPFNTAHKNLCTAKGITEDVYDEMAQLMMSQKDINDEGFIGVAPEFILAPAKQRMKHKTLLNSSAQIGQANPGVINAVQGDYKLVVTPYLTGDDFFAIANPNQMDGIEYTTLNGNDGIQSRTVYNPNYLGIDYQMWNDFGFNIISHKAFVKASVK